MYLGLDLGTSGVKALLIDEAQSVVAQASSPLTVTRPKPGWSQQDPVSWTVAAGLALDELKQHHGAQLARVKGIGLSGQMHGATLLDGADNILRPCMLWNDTRSYEEARALDANPIFRKISGNIVFPGFTAPKVLWVKNNEPDLYARTKKILLPKDYLRLWLTGEYVSDMSDASGTSWFDVGRRDWSDELLAACELEKNTMPALVEGTEISGELRKDLATRWGMGKVVVAGGAGDNAASAIGLGAVRSGSAFVSLGTSGVLFAAIDSYRPKPESAVHAFCHALPNVWHQMGVFLCATDALNWWSGVTGISAENLVGELDEAQTAPSDLVFLPYLSGERTPHNDAEIRGAFVGLDHNHDRRAMTRAILQGIAFALRDSCEALQSTETVLERVMAVGGGTRSALWLQIIANSLGMPVDLPGGGDFGAALGAARLGLIASENAEPLDVCLPPKIIKTFEPDSDMSEAFEQAYLRYQSLYPALRTSD